MTHDSDSGGQLDIQTKQDIYDHYDAVTMVGEGERDGYPALIISVRPGSGLGPADFPEKVQGLPVYVEERDEMPQMTPTNHQLLDPIRGGQVITNTTRAYSGTSSFIMTDGDKAYTASNYHVLTPNGDDDVGDKVGHLELNEDGAISGTQLIGEVSGFIPRSGTAVADFAWAELTGGTDAVNRVAQLGLVTKTGSVSTGDEVVKSGATTLVTHGKVDQVGAVVGVNGADVTMQDQVLTDMPADAGDSGSPVKERFTNKAVGVLWGGDSNGAAFSPISNIENNCPLTVATSDPDRAENEKPVAQWSYSTDPLQISVDASESYDPDGKIVRKDWDMGDGTTTAGTKGTYDYDEPGTYNVRLTVTDNSGATDTLLRHGIDIPPKQDSEPDPDPDPEPDPDPDECTYQGYPRSEWGYSGTDQEAFNRWQSCEISTDRFAYITGQGDGTAALVPPDGSDDGSGGESKQSASILLALGLAGAYLRKQGEF